MDELELREYFQWRIWADSQRLLDYSGNDPDLAVDANCVRIIAKHLSAEGLEAVARKLHEAVAEVRGLLVEAMKSGDAENPYKPNKPVPPDGRSVIDRWLDSQRGDHDAGDDHA